MKKSQKQKKSDNQIAEQFLSVQSQADLAGAAAICREASRNLRAPHGPQAKKGLLAAAIAAQRECDGFSVAARDARNLSAVLEMLRHLVCDGGGNIVDADWNLIAHLLDDCTERSVNVRAALDRLAEFEILGNREAVSS